MPTYVYKNIETGETYEFKHGMREDALTRHPETGAPIKRILSAPGIAFRGSGFYANDSRPKQGEAKPSEPKTSEAPASKAGKSSGGSGGSGE